jgi:hypothetical protein
MVLEAKFLAMFHPVGLSEFVGPTHERSPA